MTEKTKVEKKDKKQIVWAITSGDNEGYIAKTRATAREVKYADEKIIRIEIDGNNISAKFVR